MQNTKSSSRSIIIVTAALISIFVVVYFLFFKSTFEVMPDDDKAFSKENIIIIDSLKLGENEIVYWFEYGGGVTGNSIDYLAIAPSPCNLSPAIALFESGAILGIERNNKVIKVSVYEKNFRILKRSLRYAIEIDSVGSVSFQPVRTKLNVPIKQLCD